jgi:hypothetical protein
VDTLQLHVFLHTRILLISSKNFYVAAGGYPTQPRSNTMGGYPSGGGYPQAPSGGGYPQAPGVGGYPSAPGGGGYPQAPGGEGGYHPRSNTMTGGYPQAPSGGGYPQAPGTGGYPSAPGGGSHPRSQTMTGGYPQAPSPGGYPQAPGGYPPQATGGYPPGPSYGVGGYGQAYAGPPSSYPQQQQPSTASGYAAAGTNYRTQNWGSYKMNQNYGFDKGLLDRYANVLFRKYDTDGSGNLSMQEFPRLIFDFCQASNKPCPNITDLQVLTLILA